VTAAVHGSSASAAKQFKLHNMLTTNKARYHHTSDMAVSASAGDYDVADKPIRMRVRGSSSADDCQEVVQPGPVDQITGSCSTNTEEI
jgi:hypothetical protein